ncbi:MAG TPA: hypothetical protein VJT31_13445, partial [Rugosimonospora sp.]|nr:hypothetical protein [Rugosimonospora sp.]
MRVVGVRLLAAFAAAAGLLDILASTPPRLGHTYRSAAMLLSGQPLTRPQALILGLILVTVAHGVAARRRLALHVALSGLTLYLLVLVPTAPVRVVGLGALMVALVALRQQFGTPPDQRRLRLAAEVGLSVVGLVLASGGWQLVVNREGARTVGASVLGGLLADPDAHSSQGGLLAFLVATGT